MNAKEAAAQALRYIREGMEPQAAIRRVMAEQSSGMGDFAEGWDTFTTYAPWIGAGVAAFLIYRAGKKVKDTATSYIETKRRQARAAKAAWDAAI